MLRTVPLERVTALHSTLLTWPLAWATALLWDLLAGRVPIGPLGRVSVLHWVLLLRWVLCTSECSLGWLMHQQQLPTDRGLSLDTKAKTTHGVAHVFFLHWLP